MDQPLITRADTEAQTEIHLGGSARHDSDGATASSGVPEIGHVHYSHRSPWLRAALLGANDGLVSVTSLMVGVGAVESSRAMMALSGLSGLVAGSLSMAIGEYISVYGQRDTEEADLRKEHEELSKGPEACAREMEELAEIYMQRGLSEGLARAVAAELHAKDPIRAHARDELGIDMDDLSKPGQAAVVSAFAFFLGGIFPLLCGALIMDYETRFAALLVVSTGMFVLLGAIGAWLGGAPKGRAALRTTVGGWLAMAITYAVLRAFGSAGV